MTTNAIYSIQPRKLYDASYAITFKPKNNMQALSTTLDDILKKEVISANDVITLTRLFNMKLSAFDAHSNDIAEFISTLYKNTGFRFDELNTALDSLPKDKQELVYRYMLKNYEAINRSTGPIPEDLLKLIPEKYQLSFKTAWNKDTPANKNKRDLYYSCASKIGPVILNKINALPENTKADLTYLARDTRNAPATGRYDMIDLDYTQKDFTELNKTMFYLSAPKDPMTSIALTFLYIHCCTTYKYDQTTYSAEGLVKNKKGECVEAAKLYYAVLRAQNKTLPEAYNFYSEVRGHVFCSLKYESTYYFFDESGIASGKKFTPTLRTFIGKMAKDEDMIKRVDPYEEFQIWLPNSPHKPSEKVKIIDAEIIKT